jgi:hypothetical protein
MLALAIKAQVVRQATQSVAGQTIAASRQRQGVDNRIFECRHLAGTEFRIQEAQVERGVMRHQHAPLQNLTYEGSDLGEWWSTCQLLFRNAIHRERSRGKSSPWVYQAVEANQFLSAHELQQGDLTDTIAPLRNQAGGLHVQDHELDVSQRQRICLGAQLAVSFTLSA